MTVSIALAVVVGIGVSLAVVARDDHDTKPVEAVGRPTSSLPRGATVAGAWTTVPKGSSGLGAGAELATAASDRAIVLVAGRDATRGGARVWRSRDGLSWSEADRPDAPGISAIALHAGTARRSPHRGSPSRPSGVPTTRAGGGARSLAGSSSAGRSRTAARAPS